MTIETTSVAYATTSITATAVLSTWFVGLHVSLLLASICGALTFMFWSAAVPWWQKIGHFFIGTVIGYIFAPMVAAWPFTPNVEAHIYALFISALAVTAVHKTITFVSTHSLSEILDCLRSRGGKPK